MDLSAVATLAPAPVRYIRHRPEDTLLYQLVERDYPDFLAALANRDRHLPRPGTLSKTSTVRRMTSGREGW